jgi:hypothetical protein
LPPSGFWAIGRISMICGATFSKNAAEIYEKRDMRILLVDSVLVAEV